MTFFLSCISNKNPSPNNLNYFKIEGIENPFPLPADLRPVTEDELETMSKEATAPIKDFLAFKESEQVTHFKQDQYPFRQVAIFSSKKIIPIEKIYSNSFVRTVEMRIYRKNPVYLNYALVQNKFLKIGDRRAFKLKVRSLKNQKDTVYSTYYLVSTKTESLIINETSRTYEDIQDVIATFMIKSK